MLRLSRLADYALVIIVNLKKGEPSSASALSVLTNIPEPTVAKVLKLLASKKIVISTRGAKGGYTLAKDLRDISVGEIIEVIGGPISMVPCSEDSSSCEKGEGCALAKSWSPITEAVRDTLYAFSLEQMLQKRGLKFFVC